MNSGQNNNTLIGGHIMPAPTLTTARLMLRNLTADDAQNLTYLLKPEIESVSGPYMPHHASQLSRHIDRIKGNTAWGILRDDGTWIGDIAVFSIAENKIGEIAWYIDPSHWKNGYAFEAATAVLTYVFRTLGFVRISAQISADNYASRRLAEKLGFQLHAVLPEANLGGKVVDIAYYSLAIKDFISETS